MVKSTKSPRQTNPSNYTCVVGFVFWFVNAGKFKWFSNINGPFWGDLFPRETETNHLPGHTAGAFWWDGEVTPSKVKWPPTFGDNNVTNWITWWWNFILGPLWQKFKSNYPPTISNSKNSWNLVARETRQCLFRGPNQGKRRVQYPHHSS